MYKKGIKETQNKPMETTMGMVNPSWKYVESYMYSQLVIRSTGRGSRAGISWVIPSKAIKSFLFTESFLVLTSQELHLTNREKHSIK